MDMKGAKSENAPNMLNSTRPATRPVLISFSPDASTPKGLQHIPYPVKVGNQEFTITLDVIIR